MVGSREGRPAGVRGTGALLAALCLAGCAGAGGGDPGAGPADGPAGADDRRDEGRSPDAAPDPAGDPPSDPAADPAADPATVPDGSDPGDGAPADPGRADADAFTCDSFTYIDFPCDREWRCLDGTHYVPRHSVSCQEAGYDPRCCSGGGCEERPPEACPEGHVCLHGVEQPCTPVQCGRPGDPACAGEGTFCQAPAGECDAPRGGLCRSAADCDWAWSWQTRIEGWVCGCDGLSYPSDCDRQAAGTSLRHALPCCDPSRLAFPQDNPAGHTGFVACVTDAAGAGAVEQVAFADCLWGPEGVLSLGCRQGEGACRGALYAEEGSTRVDDEWWPRICGLTGLPGVREVHGVGGAAACAGVPCAAAPLCDDPCPSPCGCCPCPEGEFRCSSIVPDVPIAYEQCLYGCWRQISEACPVGQACRSAPAGQPPCETTCASVLFAWGNLQQASCFDDNDCVVVPGACGIGLGNCWEVVHWYDAERGLPEALAAAWADLHCTGPACRCGPAPSGATCVEGACQAVP